MAFQEGLDFSDGNISIDRLRVLSENQDFVYQDPNLGLKYKSAGILGLLERTTNYTQTLGFSNIMGADQILEITPPTENRLVALHFYCPTSYANNEAVYFIYKDGMSLYAGYGEKKTDNTTKYVSSINYMALDVLPEKRIYTYGVLEGTGGFNSINTTGITSNRPIQFWVEDLGINPGLPSTEQNIQPAAIRDPFNRGWPVGEKTRSAVIR